jgi:hypothetical protein
MGYEFHCVCGLITTVETDGEKPDEVYCSLCGKVMRKKRSKAEGSVEPFVEEKTNANLLLAEAELV